jgi:hypothetical protein
MRDSTEVLDLEGEGDHVARYRSNHPIVCARDAEMTPPGCRSLLGNLYLVAGTEHILPLAIGNHQDLVTPRRELGEVHPAQPNLSGQKGETGCWKPPNHATG